MVYLIFGAILIGVIAMVVSMLIDYMEVRSRYDK